MNYSHAITGTDYWFLLASPQLLNGVHVRTLEGPFQNFNLHLIIFHSCTSFGPRLLLLLKKKNTLSTPFISLLNSLHASNIHMQLLVSPRVNSLLKR